jgi:predicted aldo/keto reductase-like oxidoreductase
MMIKNKQSTMRYRRFGNTDQWLSTITLGRMRFHEGWQGRVISLRPR